jgi:transcriptional regulator with XRE-family HTH domain
MTVWQPSRASAGREPSTGNANSGRRPDQKRHQQVAKLRAQGLALEEIARCLGITRGAVGAILRKMKLASPPVKPRYQVLCCACDTVLWPDCPVGKNSAVLCLDYLARHPDPSFGQRLKAHRMAAKLTPGQMAAQTGLAQKVLYSYESGSREPNWRNLTLLLDVLGLRLLQVPPVQPLAARRWQRKTASG